MNAGAGAFGGPRAARTLARRRGAVGWARGAAVAARHLLLLAASAIVILPFLWMVASSLKTPEEIVTAPLRLLPDHPRWANYWEAIRAAPFGRFFLNSLGVSAAITIGQLTTGAMAAFALARRNFPGRSLVFGLLVATIMIPAEITLIPDYLIVRTLGWIDTYAALTVPFLASGLAVFLLRQAFLAVPRELDEAARIDGASGLGVLWRIVLPLCKPTLAALAALTFLTSWNSYLWPLVVTNRMEMRPVQVGLRAFMDLDLGNRWPQLMAASTLVMLPVLALFVAVQRHLAAGLVSYGLKG